MKNFAIISLAVLITMCACTKNEAVQGPQHEITFSVAKYMGQTKADEEKVDPADYADNYADVPFGTYAWFYGDEEGAEAQAFMEDESVSFNGSEWKPSLTYYWPKSGSIDFISYSPKSISDLVTIDEETISIADYEVAHESEVDVMYADKAIGCTENVLTYFYEGVPTLFRHALAKINVNVKTSYDEKVVVEGDDETSWAITVTKLDIQNYYNTGSVKLALDEDDAWELPAGAVWTNDGNTVDLQEFDLPEDATICSTASKPFVEDYFVLPQDLDAEQTIEIIVDIVTTLPNGNTITETGVKLTAPMDTENFTAWQMNKDITYDLIITPAAGPYNEPVAILFDPAVKDWEESDPASIEIKK